MPMAAAEEYLKEASQGNENVAAPGNQCRHLRWAIYMYGFQMVVSRESAQDYKCHLL